VNASSNAPLSGGNVTLSLINGLNGTLDATTGTLNATGVFTTKYHAPTTAVNVSGKIRVNVSAEGYVSNSSEVSVSVIGVQPSPPSDTTTDDNESSPGFGLFIATVTLITAGVVVLRSRRKNC